MAHYPRTFVQYPGQSVENASKFRCAVSTSKTLNPTFSTFRLDLNSRFSILSWNVHFWRTSTYESNYARIVEEVIPALSPSFIALQEVPNCSDNFRTSSLSSVLSSHLTWNESDCLMSHVTEPGLDLGNATFSNRKFVSKESVDLLQFRTALFTVVHVSESLPNLLLVNLHLEVESPICREQQIENVLYLLENHPVKNQIIMGDFNSWKDSNVLVKCFNRGFEDVFDVLQCARPNFTCWTGTVIDFVLVRGVEVRSSVHKAFAYQTDESDHLPIVVDLRIN